jgi:hypothetical protein
MLQVLALRLGLVAAVIAAVGGAWALGSWSGSAAVRAEWASAADRQRSVEQAVSEVVENMAMRVSIEIKAALAEVDQRAQEVADAADAAEKAPVDDACRDVRRGLPADVLRAIDKVR